MYEYRTLSVSEQTQVLQHRRERGLPLHAPPHYPDGRRQYILTAACFEHRPLMADESRRRAFQTELIGGLSQQPWVAVEAWVILPNHYHVLASVDLARFRQWIRLLHSRVATRWNKQDQAQGRQVWFRFQDRQIRSERHYWATLNYIHANPVKHGWARKAAAWDCTSYHAYLAEHGREALIELWQRYPVDDYGADWDGEGPAERHSADAACLTTNRL